MKFNITKALYVSLLVLSGMLLNGCSTTMRNGQSYNQEDFDFEEDFDAEEDLQFDETPSDDEQVEYLDDQIHAVDWPQVLQLLQAGGNVTQKDEEGISTWSQIIRAPTPNALGEIDETTELLQRAQVVEELLKRGFPVDESIDEYGNTALIWAASHGQLPIVEVLLKHKANVNAVNNNGDTALILATSPHYVIKPGFHPLCEVSYDKHAQIVQVLLQANADVTVKNKAGKTALSLAQENLAQEAEKEKKAEEKEIVEFCYKIIRTASSLAQEYKNENIVGRCNEILRTTALSLAQEKKNEDTEDMVGRCREIIRPKAAAESQNELINLLKSAGAKE